MKHAKLDWLKAVKERPEDAAAILKAWSNGAYVEPGYWIALKEAARVQSVEEAESALAKLVEENYCELSDARVHLRVHKAVDALKAARAREAAEESK